MAPRVVARLAFLVFCLALCSGAWADPPVQSEPGELSLGNEAALSAPFDLKGDPKLSEGELRYILSEGSRTLAGDFIEGSSGTLTLGELVPLLRETSAAGVQDLRRKQAEGRLGPEDRQEAVRLLWERRNMLAPEDKGFLENLLTRIYGKVPEKGRQPGQTAPQAAGKAQSPGAALGAKVPPGDYGTSKDELYVRFMDRLVLNDRGKPEERKALQETVAKMLRSPTARGIAAQFVGLDQKVQIGYVRMPGSTLTEERGKKDFTGTMGQTYTHRRPMVVEMNEFYLQTSPDRVENASNLAHELLGHAFRSYQAEARGLTKVMDVYTDDETNARLMGWITQAELGGKLDSTLTWQYMNRPEQYYDSLATAHSYYAQAFNGAQMRDPVKTLEARLASIAKSRQSYESWRTTLTGDRQAIQHFTTDPGHRSEHPPASFNMVRTETDNRLDTYIPQWLDKWTDMEKTVKARIDYYNSPAGRKELEAIQGAAKDPFFQDFSAELVRLTGILKKEAQGRSEAADTAQPPPTPGQITRERLRELVKEDKTKHPDHWKGR